MEIPPTLLIIKMVVLISLLQVLSATNNVLPCAAIYALVVGGYTFHEVGSSDIPRVIGVSVIAFLTSFAWFFLLRHFHHKPLAWWAVLIVGLGLFYALESGMIPAPGL